ncbi:hypothetical protein HK100_003858 [Physocladia obscura]|uniref:F-box domain-containing protein n=1 Tax=Physocladia obscura TaxID=109957 RepID=A0AAD5TCT4_9FUNG|nr:hypothetical protein HK100_003858 [Physocladia obscura]
MLNFDEYPEADRRTTGSYAHATLGYSSVAINTNFEANESAMIEESVGGARVIIVGARNGKASRARVYERQSPARRISSASSQSDASLFGALFSCFAGESAESDNDDPDFGPGLPRGGNPSIFSRSAISGYGPPAVDTYPYPLQYSSPSNQYLYPYPYPPSAEPALPSLPLTSLQNPSTNSNGKNSISTLFLPRSSSLSSSVLTLPPILARLFPYLSPGQTQRIARVCKVWRSAAFLCISDSCINVSLKWIPSPAFPSGIWDGRFMPDQVYSVDNSGLTILQLNAWTFGTIFRKSNESAVPAYPPPLESSSYTVIPVPHIEEISVTFPIVQKLPIKHSASKKSFKDASGPTTTRTVNFTVPKNHFQTQPSFNTSKSAASVPTAVLFSENCAIYFDSTGCGIQSIRLGKLASTTVTTNKGNTKVSYDYGLCVKKNPSIYSQLRWMQLIKFEAEVMSVMGGNNIDDGSMSPLMACFESCAVRNYLSCPEKERILAFKNIITTVLSGSSSPGNTFSDQAGTNILGLAMSKLAKIAHRVDILLMLDMPFTQRAQRLNEYHVETWRLWMNLLPSFQKNDVLSLTKVEDADHTASLFDDIDLTDDNETTSDQIFSFAETHVTPVVGGVALRVFGYRGNLKDYENIYEFIHNTIVPQLS